MSAGPVIFLLDESAAMAAQVKPQPLGAQLATAVNGAVKQLGLAAPAAPVAVVGYQTAADGTVGVGSRWGGPLAGRAFVPAGEAAASPLRTETRTSAKGESVPFAVWYDPAPPAGAGPQVAAFEFCRGLLAQLPAGGPPAVVLHVFAGGSGDGNPHKVVADLQAAGAVVLHLHLGTRDTVPATLFPANRHYLPAGPVRDLFDRASPLTPAQAAALKEHKLAIQPAARGLVYNAKLIDLVRFVGLAKAHAVNPAVAAAPVARQGPPPPPRPGAPKAAPPAATPTAAPPPAPVAFTPAPVPTPVAPTPASIPVGPIPTPSPPPADVYPVLAADDFAFPLVVPPLDDVATPTVVSDPAPPFDPSGDFGSFLGHPTPADAAPTVAGPAGDPARLVVLLVDRAIASPYGGDPKNAYAKLQDRANDLLSKFAAKPDPAVSAALVCYGCDALGQPEVLAGFDGALAGREVVPAADLAGGALRTEQVTEDIPDGIGGILSLTRTKHTFLERDPAPACPPAAAFARVRQTLDGWQREHPAAAPAVVLHLTRGEYAEGDLRAAVAALAGAPLYHLVVTEAPHKAALYPPAADALETPALKLLWDVSSPLVDAAAFPKNASVKPGSRGVVVNGKFDCLLPPAAARA